MGWFGNTKPKADADPKQVAIVLKDTIELTYCAPAPHASRAPRIAVAAATPPTMPSGNPHSCNRTLRQSTAPAERI